MTSRFVKVKFHYKDFYFLINMKSGIGRPVKKMLTKQIKAYNPPRYLSGTFIRTFGGL